MLRAPTTEAAIERFIGALTMALGIGALIPRPGLGLYSILEQSGERGLWAMAMLTVGCWSIAVSYLSARSVIRICVLIIVAGFWTALTYKFLSAQLWGAAIQGIVVIIFDVDTMIRLIYAEWKASDREAEYPGPKGQKNERRRYPTSR